VTSLYQSLLKPEINIFTTSNVVLDTKRISAPLQVVIKKTKGDCEIFDNYLKSQGLNLTKLRSNDYIIACLGMTSDLKLLIMEAAPLGNLRQYLKITANETYYNMTSLKTSDMNFINQIIEGVDAVHHLGVSKYIKFLDCDQKCKLSGFASDESVRAREKWEEENNINRTSGFLFYDGSRLNIPREVGRFLLTLPDAYARTPKISPSMEASRVVPTSDSPGFLVVGRCEDERWLYLRDAQYMIWVQYDIMNHCWMSQPYNRPSLHDISVKCDELTQYEDV
ncbi:hypothetical protein LSH36_1505g00016, partial [Paralvinella palmiformis]